MIFVGVDAVGASCRCRIQNSNREMIGESATGPANLRLGAEAILKTVRLACDQALAYAGLPGNTVRKAFVLIGVAGITKNGKPGAVGNIKPGAVGNIKTRLLPARAVKQETKRHEELGHHGSEPLIRGQVAKTGPEFVLNTVAPEMLKGRQMEGRDKQHLAKAEIADCTPDAARKALTQSDNNVKKAILIVKGLDMKEADALIAKSAGNLRVALEQMESTE